MHKSFQTCMATTMDATMTNPQESRAALIRAGMAGQSAAGFLVGIARIGYEGDPDEEVTKCAVLTGHRPSPARGVPMAARGEGLRSVTSWLRSRGLEGTRGKPVALSTVQRILAYLHMLGSSRTRQLVARAARGHRHAGPVRRGAGTAGGAALARRRGAGRRRSGSFQTGSIGRPQGGGMCHRSRTTEYWETFRLIRPPSLLSANTVGEARAD